MNTQQGFYPNDLDLLKQVFDLMCAEVACRPGSTAAEAMAVSLVHLFNPVARPKKNFWQAFAETASTARQVETNPSPNLRTTAVLGPKEGERISCPSRVNYYAWTSELDGEGRLKCRPWLPELTAIRG
jgi:hypothetical protein